MYTVHIINCSGRKERDREMKVLNYLLVGVLLVLLSVSFTPAFAADRADGQLPVEGILIGFHKVKVMNPDLIPKTTTSFEFGDKCILKSSVRDRHRIILVAQDGDRVLVRFVNRLQYPVGTCSGNTLFFLPLDEYIEAASRCRWDTQCTEDERLHVQQLLRKAGE